MSPEQRTSSRDIDLTTDIYAVGVILYEIATGRKPMGRFKPPSELSPRVARKYDDIILKCLEQEPNDRFRSAVDLKDALLSALYDTQTAKKPGKSDVGSSVRGFIGNCSFLDTIKESQYGATYLVENKADGCLYIIKKCLRREMGLREAKILARLDHPNIAKIYGAGGDASKNVIVSEYAPGGSLADRLVRQYEVGEALVIARQIASGLSFAHKNNIIHGNLRPSNILFDARDQVKLTDFALPEHYAKRSMNWYSAPERKKDKRSDVYSAGVVLHQMFTTRIPEFDESGAIAWRGTDRAIPLAACKLIGNMVNRDVTRRIGSIEEVIARIEQLQSERQNILSTSDNSTLVSHTPRKHDRLRLALLIALLMATLLLAAFYANDNGFLDSLFPLTSG
jgi:serine/threonine-protein kinase